MYSLTHPIYARFYDGQNAKDVARHRAGSEIMHLTSSPLAITLHFYQRLNSGGRVFSSQVSIRQIPTVKMTWMKKASAVTDWIDNLKKKEQAIYFSILNKKHEITLLQNRIESEVLLLESVRKEIADVSRHSNRAAPSNYNQFNIPAKCLVCDKVLVKKQKNCAWRKCEGIGSTHASTRYTSSRSSSSSTSKNPSWTGMHKQVTLSIMGYTQ